MQYGQTVKVLEIFLPASASLRARLTPCQFPQKRTRAAGMKIIEVVTMSLLNGATFLPGKILWGLPSHPQSAVRGESPKAVRGLGQGDHRNNVQFYVLFGPSARLTTSIIISRCFFAFLRRRSVSWENEMVPLRLREQNLRGEDWDVGFGPLACS